MSTPAAQTVETYLNATFSAGSLMEATTALVAPIRKAFQEDGVSADELDFGQIWAPLIAAARKAAYNEEPTPEHTAIVALLASLKASGVLIRDKDNSVCQSWGGTAWTGLPGFGASMREAWNDAPPALSAQEWESLNAFAARCATAGVADFSLYCIWTLREALESPHATTLKDSKQPASSETRPATLEELVPAVAAWLDIYGADMVKHVQTGTDFAHGGNAGNPGRVGALAKEAGVSGTAFSQSRWQFWQQRLTEIAGAKDERGGREGVAKQAYRGLIKMEALGKIL